MARIKDIMERVASAFDISGPFNMQIIRQPAKISAEPESFGFRAEISQLLDLIISKSTLYAPLWHILISYSGDFLLEQGDIPSRDYLERL